MDVVGIILSMNRRALGYVAKVQVFDVGSIVTTVSMPTNAEPLKANVHVGREDWIYIVPLRPPVLLINIAAAFMVEVFLAQLTPGTWRDVDMPDGGREPKFAADHVCYLSEALMPLVPLSTVSA